MFPQLPIEMTKIIDKIKELKGEPFYSFEFFPPKTDNGLRNLLARLGRMSMLNPLFVTVTWGAGGTTSSKTLDLAITCQKDLDLTTCIHLTCTNTSKKLIDNALKAAYDNGIKNILALRGDPPREAQEVAVDQDFKYAIDLVRYIRGQYGDYFCIGVAAYPEGHVEGNDDSEQSIDHDMPYLLEKINAGADFVVTQLFYDADKFCTFYNTLKQRLGRDVVVIPGLMPINTYQLFQRATNLSHASIPPAVGQLFPPDVRHDDDKVKDIGVKLMIDIVDQIYNETHGEVNGYHFYTLNLEKSVAQIVDKSSLLSPRLTVSSRFENAIESSSEDEKEQNQQTKTIIAISSGEGTMGKEATWDDFPNGRYGDSRSPAYGEIDGYGPSLKVSSSRAYKLWGYPVDLDDITKIFIAYLSNRITALPWSELGLNPETGLIQEELIQLNEKHMFTISSQPSANGVKSTDKLFGWGPSEGYVYQKAFVEVFINKKQWNEEILPNLQGHKSVTWYLGDCNNAFDTNIKIPLSSNSVTWGCFPDKEIVQTTIIGEESFQAWNEEAFNIWREWQKLYPKNTASYNLLGSIINNFYLVTLINHDYANDNNNLWEILLQ